MPWPSGKEFASKHNKKLKGHAAEVAAAAATSALEHGKDEGTAVRIGNAAGDKAMHKRTLDDKMKAMYHRKKK